MAIRKTPHALRYMTEVTSNKFRKKRELDYKDIEASQEYHTYNKYHVAISSCSPNPFSLPFGSTGGYHFLASHTLKCGRVTEFQTKQCE